MEINLPEAYKKLYPETTQNNANTDTDYILPWYLAERKDEIIQDYLDGFYKANEQLERYLGIEAHKPRNVVITELPLVKYNGEIGVVQGAYDPVTDIIYINSAFYTPCCYPILVDMDNGNCMRVPICYRLEGNPSKTYEHEIMHASLTELAHNRYKQEIAVRKLGG